MSCDAAILDTSFDAKIGYFLFMVMIASTLGEINVNVLKILPEVRAETEQKKSGFFEESKPIWHHMSEINDESLIALRVLRY
mmetsp:Transcript_9021/g.11722  ORF Transcript_9021/g.11722 Transcript_9021/m.11722 type:complete len:82 (-) Transcript_9021:21-266(-)